METGEVKVIPITVEWMASKKEYIACFDADFSLAPYAGKFFLNFRDCGTVRFALAPDRNMIEHYRLTIEKVQSEPKQPQSKWRRIWDILMEG